jgi:hypothetical protein
MNLIVALEYNARREHPNDLRRQLTEVAKQRRAAATVKQQRQLKRREQALSRRLADAEAMADYDWDAAEADFAGFVAGASGEPGVYERWRAYGVPIRVLLRAGLRPRG